MTEEAQTFGVGVVERFSAKSTAASMSHIATSDVTEPQAEMNAKHAKPLQSPDARKSKKDKKGKKKSKDTEGQKKAKNKKEKKKLQDQRTNTSRQFEVNR